MRGLGLVSGMARFTMNATSRGLDGGVGAARAEEASYLSKV